MRFSFQEFTKSSILNGKHSYFFKLSAFVFEVSPIIGAVALEESGVGGGVMLLVVSELAELSLLFPQDMKTPVIATINNILFIMSLSFL